MTNRAPFIFPIGICLLLCVVFYCVQPVFSQDESHLQSQTEKKNQDPAIIEDETLHPGVASAWIVGRHILASGEVEEALTYLNFAYRTLPDVILIALDYQEALALGGFVPDAVKVMDKLIAAHPDSLEWRVRRSSLNLRLGHSQKALADLTVLRQDGHSSLKLLETEALILASQGNTKEAMQVYRTGLIEYPDHTAELYMGMIQLQQHTGDAQAILKICDDAMEDLPLEPAFREMVLRAYVAIGQHENAINAAREADALLLTTGVVADSFLLQLADVYVQGGQITRAIVILSDVNEAEGLGLKSSLWLARLLLGSNQIKATSELVDKIESQWPQSPRLWFLKGKLGEEEGNWELAEKHYKTAVSFKSDDPEILLALVRAILVVNEADLAFASHTDENKVLLETLKQYADLASVVAPEADSEGQLVLGYAYRGLLDYEEAILHFNLAGLDPGYRKTALTQVSICYDALGHLDKAMEILQELYKEFPEDPEVANSLGYFLAEKNMNIKQAEKLINFALKQEPGRGAYLDSKGWVYYRKNKLDEAFDFLIRAVNVLPDDPVVLEHLGIVLHEQQQYQQALDVLRRALKAGGDVERLTERIDQIESQLSTIRK